MAICNISGTKIITAYDISANELSSVYGLDGTEYPLADPNPILFSNVPEYFQTDITNALTYINGLSNDYVNYIVVTDSHYDLSRVRNTPKLFNYLYQEGRFDKLIHLGDIVDGGGFNDTGWQHLTEDDWWHFNKNWLFAQGNHDSAWSTSLATLASYFEAPSVRYTVNAKHNIYYYDNNSYKIRIIGSHHYSYKDDTDTLNAYVAAAVNKGYKWMFIGHYRVDETSDWVKDAVETFGNFICSLSGHRHTDTFRTITTDTKSLLDINLEADIQGQVNGGVGTNGEQCITLVSINPKTENIKLYRIGLSKVYDGKQWEFTGFGS